MYERARAKDDGDLSGDVVEVVGVDPHIVVFDERMDDNDENIL